MTETGIILLSDVVTVVCAIMASVFVAGRQWGEVKRDIEQLKEQVAEIRGMFVIKLRDEHVDRGL